MSGPRTGGEWPERPGAQRGGHGLDQMGLDGVWLMLRRQIRVVLLVIVAVVAGTAAYLQTLDERFRTRATIVLTLSDIRVDRTGLQLETFELSRAIVETELDVLRSRAFAGEVAEVLSLATHPEFADPPDAPATSDEERMAAIVDRLLSSYSVFRSGESLAIEIVAESGDPELAAAIANAVAQTFIDRSARRQRREIAQSVAFLERRVEALSNQITEFEIELTDFIRGNALDNEGRLVELHAEAARLAGILAVVELDRAEEQEADRIRAELAGIEAQLRAHTRADLTLSRMERALELQDSRYQILAERLKEMESQLDLVPPAARQVTVARVPAEPSWPNRRVALALSFVAATGLAFVAALLAETFNRRIWSDGDAERATGLLNFGSVPRFRRRGFFSRRHAPLQFLAAHPQSVFRESLSGILTLWANTGGGSGAKVLMVASSLPGEGKSTVAVSLAGSAARDGLRVLLVDFDVYHRGATALAGGRPQERSLEEVLAGEAEPDAAGVPSPDVSGLDLLSLSDRGGLNLQVIRQAQERLMPALRARYDLIVLDTPPVLVVDDACRLGQLADQVLIVVRWGWTTIEMLQETHERLARNGIRVVGTVLNDVNARNRRHYGVSGYTGRAAYGKRYHVGA